jgi:hypothetical protein
MKIIPAYKIAMAAGQDAGNAHAKQHGRQIWDESDWNTAQAMFEKIYAEGNK